MWYVVDATGHVRYEDDCHCSSLEECRKTIYECISYGGIDIAFDAIDNWLSDMSWSIKEIDTELSDGEVHTWNNGAKTEAVQAYRVRTGLSLEASKKAFPPKKG